MAEVEVEMLTDPDTKEQIKKQILAWEENLERLHCEQFRLKCYMASLQNGELPNPKVHPIFYIIYLIIFCTRIYRKNSYLINYINNTFLYNL